MSDTYFESGNTMQTYLIYSLPTHANFTCSEDQNFEKAACYFLLQVTYIHSFTAHLIYLFIHRI